MEANAGYFKDVDSADAIELFGEREQSDGNNLH